MICRQPWWRKVAKTDGVPLFIEELTKSVAESRSNFGLGAAIEIPATLQAALHTRLDRLAPIRQSSRRQRFWAGCSMQIF